MGVPRSWHHLLLFTCQRPHLQTPLICDFMSSVCTRGFCGYPQAVLGIKKTVRIDWLAGWVLGGQSFQGWSDLRRCPEGQRWRWARVVGWGSGRLLTHNTTDILISYFNILPVGVLGPLATGWILALDMGVAVSVELYEWLSLWSISAFCVSLVAEVMAALRLLSWSISFPSSPLLNLSSPESAVWQNLMPRWDPAQQTSSELIIHVRKRR
jgi:hypothetical protein